MQWANIYIVRFIWTSCTWFSCALLAALSLVTLQTLEHKKLLREGSKTIQNQDCGSIVSSYLWLIQKQQQLQTWVANYQGPDE